MRLRSRRSRWASGALGGPRARLPSRSAVFQLLGAARLRGAEPPPGDGAAEELERRAYGAAVAPRAVRSALEEASLATSAERLRGAEASDWFAPKPDPPFWRLVKGNLGLLRPEGPSDQ